MDDVLSSETDLAALTSPPPSLQFTLRSSPISGFSMPPNFRRAAGRPSDLGTKKPGAGGLARTSSKAVVSPIYGRIRSARAPQRNGRGRRSRSWFPRVPCFFHVLNELPSFLHCQASYSTLRGSEFAFKKCVYLWQHLKANLEPSLEGRGLLIVEAILLRAAC